VKNLSCTAKTLSSIDSLVYSMKLKRKLTIERKLKQKNEEQEIPERSSRVKSNLE